MRRTLPLQAIIAAALIAVVAACDRQAAPTQVRKTAYDRVVESGTIRAGYVNYPPGLSVDPKTAALSGAFFDILNRVGANTGLKVEYVEEVGWGTMIAGLDAGRYDVIGSPVWANSARGKVATFSEPVYYTGIGVWVRNDDARFTAADGWASINRPEVRIAAMDGSTPMLIAKTMFPAAQLVSYPDQTGEPQLFQDLTTKKADVFFAEPAQGMAFLKNNPGKIKNIASADPIKIFANVFLMGGGEARLKQLIDAAVDDLQYSGVIDEILKKYEPGPNAFYRVARPYRVD